MTAHQGLDRGLVALDTISRTPDGLTVAELATILSVDRAIAYRIVDTLVTHGLAVRLPRKKIALGPAALVLGERFRPHLLHAARPVLRTLADTTGLEAFLTVADGVDNGIPVLGAEPATATSPLRVGYRIGVPHALSRGANGIAILALSPPRPDEAPDVAEARTIGYAATRGHLQSGAAGIAAGFTLSGGIGASVGVVTVGDLDVAQVAPLVVDASQRLTAL